MTRPLLALLAASIIWGAASPIFRWALFNIPLFSLAFLRFGIAALLMYPFVRRQLPKLYHHQLLANGYWLMATGLLGVTFNITFFFLGLKLSTALNAGLLLGSIPVFSAAAGVFFLKEKVSQRVVAGVLLGFAGIILLFAGSLLNVEAGLALLGDLFLLLAVLSWVCYEVISKKLFAIFSPLVVTFFSFLIGALTFLPLSIGELFQDPSWLAQLDVRGYSGIIFGAFLSSFAAYLLWQWGLSKTQVQKAGVFLYILPVVSAAIALPLLGEALTPSFLAAAALIFIGLWLAERRSS